MGCDAGNGTYYQLYSDDRGVCRVYAMSIADTEWRLWRRAPVRPALHRPVRGRRPAIVGRWESGDDGANYKTDFELTYVRVE